MQSLCAMAHVLYIVSDVCVCVCAKRILYKYSYKHKDIVSCNVLRLCKPARCKTNTLALICVVYMYVHTYKKEKLSLLLENINCVRAKLCF